jgi:hypothetical protein
MSSKPFRCVPAGFSAVAALSLLLAAAPASAGPLDGRYAISLAGIPIGKAFLIGNVGDRDYRLELTAKMTGLAGAVTTGKGAASVSGGIAGGRLSSNGYALTATNSELTRTIQIAIANGAVRQVAITPPFEERPDRVPVTDAHKQNVVDPVSALLMPMRTTGDALDPQNCNRTIPVFDGVQRFNITLTPAGTQTIKDASVGYQGPALVCAARYEPISGHRPNRKAIQYMVNNRDMNVWLVPVAGSRTLVPFRISVKTQIGTAVLEIEKSSGLGASVSAQRAQLER